MIRYVAMSVVLCGLMCSSALAKRAPPATIKPLEQDGIRYVVPNDDGRRAYVQAWDAKSNKKLWEADLFRTDIKPDLEEDVQWVFVKSMKIDNGKPKFVDEKGRTFLLDPATRKVEQAKADK